MACAEIPRVLRLVLDWDMVFTGHTADGRCRVVEPEYLPLAPETVTALNRLGRAFPDLQFADGPQGEDDDVDRVLIEGEALRLWRLVRDELGPSYRVTFSSVRFHTDFDTPEEYERVVGDERRRL